MKTKAKRVLPIVLTAIMLLCLLAGCKNSSSPSPSPSPSTSTETPPDSNSPPAEDPNWIGDITLTFAAGNQCTSVVDNYNQIWFIQEAEKLTGVHIEWIHTTDESAIDLLIAGGEYPDLMFYYNENGGGLGRSYEEGVVIDMADLLAEHAPNFMAIMEQYPEYKHTAYTAEGRCYGIGWEINDAGKGIEYVGPMINKTWLDELGLAIPTTLDEWEICLAAFKERDPTCLPFVSGDMFQSTVPMIYYAYNFVNEDWINVNGQIKYSAFEPGYKECVERTAKWYANGWLDNECITDSWEQIGNKILSGNVGSCMYWLTFDQTTGCEWVGVPYPSVEKGGKVNITRSRPAPNAAPAFVISTKNQYQVESVKWFDFFFGEVGSDLATWGPLGVTYEEVNGEKRFLESVFNPSSNPEWAAKEWSTWNVLDYYTTMSHGFPSLRQYDAMLQTNPAGEEAYGYWNSVDNKYTIPPRSNLTADEEAEYRSIRTDFNTVSAEAHMKFLIGTKSFDEWDSFIEELRSVNYERQKELLQLNADRYYGIK